MLFYERLILEEGTMEKLKFKQIMSLTLTLFAIFRGRQYGFSARYGTAGRRKLLAGFDWFHINRCRYCFYLALLRLFWWVMKLRI